MASLGSLSLVRFDKAQAATVIQAEHAAATYLADKSLKLSFTKRVPGSLAEFLSISLTLRRIAVPYEKFDPQGRTQQM